MIITKRDTSINRVERFLEITGDENSLHKEPHRVFPGMFYLPFCKNIPYPIKRAELIFNKLINYPCELELDCQNSRTNGRYIFREGNIDLCGVDFKYGNNQRNGGNPNLAEFAELVMRKSDDVNLRKIWMMSLIPGELVKKYGNIVYYYQTMEFGDVSLEGSKLNIEEIGKIKKVLNLWTTYTNTIGQITGKGRAQVAVVDG